VGITADPSPFISIDWPAISHYFSGKYCENQNDEPKPGEWMDSLTDGEEGEELQSEWVDERQELEANKQQCVIMNEEDELDQQN